MLKAYQFYVNNSAVISLCIPSLLSVLLTCLLIFFSLTCKVVMKTYVTYFSLPNV